MAPKDSSSQILRLDPKTTLIPLTVLLAAIPVIFWAGAAWTGQGSEEKERIVVLETEAAARGETLEDLKAAVSGAATQLGQVREELAGLRAEIRSLQVVHPLADTLSSSQSSPHPGDDEQPEPERTAPIGPAWGEPHRPLDLLHAGGYSGTAESR